MGLERAAHQGALGLSPKTRVTATLGAGKGQEPPHYVLRGSPAMAGLNNSVILSLLGTTVLGESMPADTRLLKGPLPAAFFC